MIFLNFTHWGFHSIATLFFIFHNIFSPLMIPVFLTYLSPPAVDDPCFS